MHVARAARLFPLLTNHVPALWRGRLRAKAAEDFVDDAPVEFNLTLII